MDPVTEIIAAEGRLAFHERVPLTLNPYAVGQHAALTARLAAFAWNWGWLLEQAATERRIADEALTTAAQQRSAMQGEVSRAQAVRRKCSSDP